MGAAKQGTFVPSPWPLLGAPGHHPLFPLDTFTGISLELGSLSCSRSEFELKGCILAL